MFVILQKHKSN